MSSGTFTKKVLECPVCKGEVHGLFTYNMQVGDIGSVDSNSESAVTAKLVLKGVDFKHDCNPKVTR